MDCESQLQLQQQYKITEFGRSAEFPRIPCNSAETWKFRGNGQIPRLGSKFRSPRKTVVPTHDINLGLGLGIGWVSVSCLSIHSQGDVQEEKFPGEMPTRKLYPTP